MDDQEEKYLEKGGIDIEATIDIEEESTSKWKTGLGCLGLSIYFLMALFEIFVIYDWMVWRFELNGFLAALSAIFLAFIPGLGSLLAYWGATEVWGWESMTAIIVFFWYYVPIAFYVFITIGVVVFLFLMFIKGKIMSLFSKG